LSSYFMVFISKHVECPIHYILNCRPWLEISI
jgi:hypothetical protein